MREFPFWIMHLALVLAGLGLFGAVFLACAPPVPPKDEEVPDADEPDFSADPAEARSGSEKDRARTAYEALFRWERGSGGKNRLILIETTVLRGDFSLPRRKADPTPYDGFWFWEALDARGECVFREEFPHPGFLHADFPDENGDLHGGPVRLDSADFTLVVPEKDWEGRFAEVLVVYAKENGNISEMGRWPLRSDRGK